MPMRLSSSAGRTVRRHLADLRARSGLTTQQLIYSGRAAGWLVVPSLERPPEASTWDLDEAGEQSKCMAKGC